MLVMASTELYTPVPSTSLVSHRSPHVFLDAFMEQKDLAGPVVQPLLGHFISARPPPSSLGLFSSTAPQTSFHLVKHAATTVLWLPYVAYSSLLRRGGSPGQDGGRSSLAETAVAVLLALYFYSPSFPVGGDAGAGAGVATNKNPFQQAMRVLSDSDEGASDDAAESGRISSTGAPVVPYAALFESLGKALLLSESSILLLYVMLHNTPHFNEYCMVGEVFVCR